MGMRNILRLWSKALTEGEYVDMISGDSLQLRPKADDTGKLQIGDGTNDMDVEVYLGSSTEKVTFDVGNSAVTSTVPLASPVKVTNISTTPVTLSATQLNGYITNRGATGTIAITLPDTATTGWWFEYWGVADQTITFASETADTLLAGLNDAAADSLAFSTASNKIGARATAFYDGTQWHIHALQGTATIATA